MLVSLCPSEMGIVHQNSTRYILQLNVWHSNWEYHLPHSCSSSIEIYAIELKIYIFFQLAAKTHKDYLNFNAANDYCQRTLLGKYTSEVSKASFIFDERSRYECHSIRCRGGKRIWAAVHSVFAALSSSRLACTLLCQCRRAQSLWQMWWATRTRSISQKFHLIQLSAPLKTHSLSHGI